MTQSGAERPGAIAARGHFAPQLPYKCYLTWELRNKMKKDLCEYSASFIREICKLYGDRYDDRIEDSRPPAAGWKCGFLGPRDAGIDWLPGMPSEHKSLKSFQTELKEKYGIILSSCKIRKILISGGVWTTERSREIQALFSLLTSGTEDEPALKPDKAILEISRRLGISRVMVTVNLPYSKGVNGLEDKSKNAVRCANYRRRKAEKQIEG